MTALLYCSVFVLILSTCECSHRNPPVPQNETRGSPKYDNPNFIRDRYKNIINKPEMPESFINKYKLPFHPAWMDYCDPYKCNDYHKIACGLNRRNMKFKWFQNVCHMILNNMCATYRGSLKFDLIDTKYCYDFVMFLRSNCPVTCDDESHQPLCAWSATTNTAVIFKNQCALKKANCNDETLDDYEEVAMSLCTLIELYKIYGNEYNYNAL